MSSGERQDTALAETQADPALAETHASGPGASPSAGSVPPPGPGSFIERGTSLGRYLVLGHLGGGGMGVVYAAYDPELDRKVALKLLRSDGRDGATATEGRTRLLREAQAMARLAHPNVIAVHDVGTVGDQVFIAMELVDGETLRSWLDREPRGWREVLAMFAQAGRALAAAHVAGIIHRDFKPDNVLVGKDGRVRVLDFGLARATGEPSVPEAGAAAADTLPPAERSGSNRALETPLTRSGTLMGTPAYMAPEQLLGRATDARTDQFSFCVALYEGLYGARPFGGKSLAQLREAVTYGRVDAAPRDARVPSWVRSVVLRGLRPDPEQRHPSMDALVRELGKDPAARSRRVGLAVLGASAVAALVGWRALERPPAPICRDGRSRIEGIWDDAHRGAVRSAFAATGLPYATDTLRGVERALDGYTASWTAMYTDACEATRVRGVQSAEVLDLRMECLDQDREQFRALVDVLSRADPGVVQHASQAAAALPDIAMCADTPLLREPVRPPAGRAARDHVGAARAKLAMAAALHHAGKYDEGRTLASEVLADARPLGYRPLVAEALEELGELQYQAGAWKDAASTLEDAALEAQASRHDRVAAQAWVFLVYVAVEDARYERGHAWARLAEATLDRMGENDELRAGLETHLGTLLSAEGQEEDAYVHYQRSLEIRRRRGEQDTVSMGNIESNLAISCEALGRTDEAIAISREAVETMRRAVGDAHPQTAWMENNLGEVLVQHRRWAEGRPVIERALDTWTTALGPDHPNLGYALDNLGVVAIEEGRYDEARDRLGRAFAIWTKALGPDHPDIASNLMHQGELSLAEGRAHEALDRFRRSLALWQKAVGDDSPDLAPVLLGMGRAELRLHHASDAVAPLERALRLRERAKQDGAQLADIRFALARALSASHGDLARIQDLVRQSREAYVTLGDERKPELEELDHTCFGTLSTRKVPCSGE